MVSEDVLQSSIIECNLKWSRKELFIFSFIDSLFYVCKVFRIFDSPLHFEAVFQVGNFMSHFSVHDPVYAKILDKNNADTSKNSLVSFDIVVVVFIIQNQSFEALYPADCLFWIVYEINKILKSDILLFEQRLQVRNS